MSDPIVVGSEDRTLPAVVYALYLLGFATLVTPFIGLVIANAQLGTAGPRMATHYTFLIRTFWISIAWWLIGGALVIWGIPLSIILVGIPLLILGGLILAAVGVWWAVRCILGVIYVAREEAYPRPWTWLV